MGNEKNKKSRQGKLGGASSVAKRKGGVDDEADVRKKKKSKTDVLDMEEEGEISEDDCGIVGDDEADEAPDNEEVPNNEEVPDEANGHGGIEEEGGRDLTVFFGEVARNDDCENDEDSGDEWYWEHEKEVPDPLSSDDENEEQSIPSLAYREDVDPEAMLGLGNTFSTAEEFKHTLLRYTLKTRRNIKLYRSTALKLGAKCEDGSCPWRVYCSYEKSKQKLMIKCYVNEHKCEITGHSKFLKCSTIAMLFAERLRLNPKITKHEIASEIQREYRMFVSVEACGNAKTKVMKERKASHEEHFNKIWDYQAEIFRTNPGTTMDIETIHGPTVGSHLLAAVGHDGDNRIVPIACTVVEVENDTNWDWFVRHLANDLGLKDGKGYAILSDKQKGLFKAVHTILPEVEHRQCCRHIFDNWKKSSHDMTLQRLFWRIARSYTAGDYKMWSERLKEYNPGAYATLQVTKPETWSRAYFKLETLCNDNLNNLSESFNRTIREARRKPFIGDARGYKETVYGSKCEKGFNI
ncbi:PREDICTED: uncharacterized protein LOC106338244 [Brassica oleracea var. oleracea]|uniref:uncharacterized protein LOC106338244 n=1 Tax=Brassica oleracea var. oleracea TaxID=109376 RepID=UPI0006A7196B|nr:PREDICTED: uncharacterized protein LOC106338244 [Brassica oleracea var. oleracea]